MSLVIPHKRESDVSRYDSVRSNINDDSFYNEPIDKDELNNNIKFNPQNDVIDSSNFNANINFEMEAFTTISNNSPVPKKKLKLKLKNNPPFEEDNYLANSSTNFNKTSNTYTSLQRDEFTKIESNEDVNKGKGCCNGPSCSIF